MSAEMAVAAMLALSVVMVSVVGFWAVSGELRHRGHRPTLRLAACLLLEAWTAPSGVVCPAERIEP